MQDWLLVIVGLVIIIALDFLWLGIVMKSFYIDQVGSLLRMKEGGMDARIAPAVLVWLCLSAAIVLFALPKATTWPEALAWSALLGFLIYGVYDLTNYALFKTWPLGVVAADMAWGAVLNGITGLVLWFLR